jgi:hypothetical protein
MDTHGAQKMAKAIRVSQRTLGFASPTFSIDIDIDIDIDI